MKWFTSSICHSTHIRYRIKHSLVLQAEIKIALSTWQDYRHSCGVKYIACAAGQNDEKNDVVELSVSRFFYSLFKVCTFTVRLRGRPLACEQFDSFKKNLSTFEKWMAVCHNDKTVLCRTGEMLTTTWKLFFVVLHFTSSFMSCSAFTHLQVMKNWMNSHSISFVQTQCGVWKNFNNISFSLISHTSTELNIFGRTYLFKTNVDIRIVCLRGVAELDETIFPAKINNSSSPSPCRRTRKHSDPFTMKLEACTINVPAKLFHLLFARWS